MFLLHCVCSAIASLVGVPLLGVIVAALAASFQAPSNANPFLVFLPVAIANGVAGSLACRKISGDGARWVWIPWAVVMLRLYTNYPPAHTLGQHAGNVWTQFFSNHCGATECLGRLFAGMPFVGSVVYAVTSVVVRWDASGTAAPPRSSVSKSE
jgi:hypothetical protein